MVEILESDEDQEAGEALPAAGAQLALDPHNEPAVQELFDMEVEEEALGEPPAPSVPSAPPPQSDSTKSAAGRLSEAKALLEAGLITDEMFAEKQKSILETL